MDIVYHPIGTVKTPYPDMAPFQGRENDENGPFILELKEEYASGLQGLSEGQWIVILFHIDRARGYNGSNLAHPPHMNGKTIGLWASRSPNRPNPIGMDTARIVRIEGNLVYTTGLSALDGTPLLDLKPVISSCGRERGQVPGQGQDLD